MYAQKEALCRRSSVYRNPFIGRALVDALTSVHLKSGPPLSAALCSAWKSRFFETWSYSKRARSLNIWPSLNIEPTSSQISEETLKSLKLRNSRKNSRASNNTEQSNQQKGIPRVTSRDDDRRNSFNQPGNETTDQRHFNLKAGIKQNLYSAGTGRIISKVRTRVSPLDDRHG